MSLLKVNEIQNNAGTVSWDISQGSGGIPYQATGSDEIRTVESKLGEFVSVKDFGAHSIDEPGYENFDSTDAIQAALDSNAKSLYFPKGTYKVTQNGANAYCLLMSKNISIHGDGPRSAFITSDLGAGDTTTSIIKVEFTTEISSYGDVRNWSFDGVAAYHKSGGKHALWVATGTKPILTSQITNCAFNGKYANGGYGIYIDSALSHSRISLCTIDTIYAKCGDANVIEKNLIAGTACGVTYDCANGVRNNILKDNTIVCRDGAVTIINGDNIRIINNQCEQSGANASSTSSMVYVQGVDRVIYNTVIEDNNLGGGTNLDHLVYLDNAQRSVVEKNNLIAVNVAEVYLTANAKYNIVGRNNRVATQVANPRTDQLFIAEVVDLGVGNMGTFKSGTDYDANDWSGSDFWKDESGVVHFIGTFSLGTTTGGTVMANMPTGFWPYIQPDTSRRNLLTYSEQADNAVWMKGYTTVTNNTSTSPDGTTTADKISVTATTNYHFIGSSTFSMVGSTAYTVSGYLKRSDGSSANVIRWELNDNSTVKYIRGTLDLTSGSIVGSANGTYFSGASYSVTNAGNGWWRISITFTTVASGAESSTYRLHVTPNNVASIYTSYLGDPNTHTLLVWGFQAEQSGSTSLYQRVVDAATFETVFTSRKLLATTDSGVGYVDITRHGVLSVGSLPSNVAVGIESFQSSAIQN